MSIHESKRLGTGWGCSTSVKKKQPFRKRCKIVIWNCMLGWCPIKTNFQKMAAGVLFVIRVSWNHPNDLPLAKWQQASERPFSHTSWLPKTTVFPTHPKNKQANAKQALPFPTVFFHRAPFLALQEFPPLEPGNSGFRGWMIQQVAITSSGRKGLGGKASSCPTNSKALVSDRVRFGINSVFIHGSPGGEHFFGTHLRNPPKN